MGRETEDKDSGTITGRKDKHIDEHIIYIGLAFIAADVFSSKIL